MTEELRINNFASMRDVNLKINQINILIGPQATGKSVCAKLLYYFKSFPSELINSVLDDRSKHDFDEKLIEKFNTYFPSTSLGLGSFEVEYKIDNNFIRISKTDKGKLTLKYSDIYKNLLTKTKNQHKSALSKLNENKDFDIEDIDRRTRLNFLKHLSEELGTASSFTQYFIPAGRSFFANLQSTIFSFLSSSNALDPFLIEFGSFYERVKTQSRYIRRGPEVKPKYIEIIDELSNLILNGKYIHEKGKDYLLLHDNRKINIANASSGQQESLPLALIFKFLQFVRFSGGGATLYIEEPEAHLFPTAQRYIVELIATVFNTSKNKFQFFITTHSPYIITSFNNLIYAGDIQNKLSDANRKKLHKIISEEKILNGSSINSYSVDNGKSDILINPETQFISTNIIDEVSNSLALQMEELLNLD